MDFVSGLTPRPTEVSSRKAWLLWTRLTMANTPCFLIHRVQIGDSDKDFGRPPHDRFFKLNAMFLFFAAFSHYVVSFCVYALVSLWIFTFNILVG